MRWPWQRRADIDIKHRDELAELLDTARRQNDQVNCYVEQLRAHVAEVEKDLDRRGGERRGGR